MEKGSGVNVIGLLTTSVAGDDFTMLPSLHLPAPEPEIQARPSMPSNPPAPRKYLARTRHCDTQPVQTTC